MSPTLAASSPSNRIAKPKIAVVKPTIVNGKGQNAAYSLEMTNPAGYVNCGTDPSVVDLHTGDFTVDMYWQCPSLTEFADYALYPLGGQGKRSVDGWYIYHATMTLPTSLFRLHVIDGAASAKMVQKSFTLVEGNWYYFRGRRSGNTIYVSVNAGGERANATLAAGGTASTEPLRINSTWGTWTDYSGGCVYFHLWNSDQGALAAVPTSPIAIGANTAARYRFQDGAGVTLEDDSGNGNTGTIVNGVWQLDAPATWTP